MKEYNRREFLGLATSGLALAGCGKYKGLEQTVEESSWIQTTLAHERDRKAQLYFAEDVVVKPSMVSNYEEDAKEVISQLYKYKYPYRWFAFSTDDFHYYFAYPIKNFADKENIDKAWYKFVKNWGEEK